MLDVVFDRISSKVRTLLVENCRICGLCKGFSFIQVIWKKSFNQAVRSLICKCMLFSRSPRMVAGTSFVFAACWKRQLTFDDLLHSESSPGGRETQDKRNTAVVVSRVFSEGVKNGSEGMFYAELLFSSKCCQATVLDRTAVRTNNLSCVFCEPTDKIQISCIGKTFMTGDFILMLIFSRCRSVSILESSRASESRTDI